MGGVDQKVAAADKAGASLFLVPEAEADAAEQEAGNELRVVPVNTVDDAIQFLRG